MQLFHFFFFIVSINGFQYGYNTRYSICKTRWPANIRNLNKNVISLTPDEIDTVDKSKSKIGYGKLPTMPTINVDYNVFLLNFVAILWGTQHVCIKSSLSTYDSASVLNFWRFIISTALFSPSLFSMVLLKRNKSKGTLKAGVELGLWTFLGFACQAIGLLTTTASRSAFLLYLNVKIVPFLAAVFLKRKISASTWGSAFLALSGTYLLSTDGGPMNVGDIWCIAAALFSALFILRLESISTKNDAAELNGVSFATVAFLCSLWVLGDNLLINYSALSTTTSSVTSFGFSFDIFSILKYITEAFQKLLSPFLANPLPVIYLGAITTGLCNYLQTLGQRTIPAEKAAIIYSLDPLYGAVFSRIFLDERLGFSGYVGGLLILLGVWLSSVSPVASPAAVLTEEVESRDEKDEVMKSTGMEVEDIIPMTLLELDK